MDSDPSSKSKSLHQQSAAGALLMLFFLLPLLGASQSAPSNVDLERIPQKKVRKYFEGLSDKGVQSLSTLTPQCFIPNDSSQYSYHEKIYLVEAPIEKVWPVYKNTHPAQAWNGKMVSFGLLYDKTKDQISYADDPYPSIIPQQLLFVHLKIMGGLYKLALALEINRIEDDAKLLEFCYVEYGKSQGTQRITLSPQDGKTQIIHSTYFKSDSKFRDKRLYPKLHTKAIDEYHKSIKQLVMKEETSSF